MVFVYCPKNGTAANCPSTQQQSHIYKTISTLKQNASDRNRPAQTLHFSQIVFEIALVVSII